MRPVSLTINLNHLVANYHLLQKQAGKAIIMAVVKANAYGHGLLPIAQALYQCGCRSFAVTDAVEGIQLRKNIATDANITLFSGVDNIDDAKACVQHQLNPVCVHSTQLTLLQKANFKGFVWLKVDTGMNRLGAENLELLISETEQAEFQLAGIMSHLACADTPEHPLNLQQIERFKKIQQDTQAPAYSLLNSAGLIAFSDNIPTDVVRPGLALYGIEPIADQPLGLKPIAELRSQIMQIRGVKQGESVSYGGTWVAPHDMRIAIVAMGYADGLPRLLSNQGHAWHSLGALPIVGRVCMDYCMLAVEDAIIKQGDKVVFFGSELNQPQANQVAAQCQTIAYELFTHLSERLHRTYIGES